MKIILFAAALTLGSVASAQSGNTVDDVSQASGPRGVTQQNTDPDGEACTPAGYNANTTGYPVCPGNEAPSTRPCSKTVKDRCVQTYERGVRR